MDDTTTVRCTFYDMKSSNNAARIRLWIRFKGLQNVIETKWMDLRSLESSDYAAINPQKKVPALVTESGLCLFESAVIMQYLEDRFSGGVSLVLDTPEERAMSNLMVRVHDIYIASPNCTQPNFTHTQGCMYLPPYPTPHFPARRTMNAQTRATKLAEIYKQLSWLETRLVLPYMAGDRVTHADCTWFPTAVFMEFMLPLVFGWSPIFHENISFPKLTAWFQKCLEIEYFVWTRNEIRQV